MAMKLGKSGLPTLLKDGMKHMQGLEGAVYRNIEACVELTQLTRTSMGPNGMNKMIINHLEKLFVTSDAATIIKELEVQHPAAKIIVHASQQQEAEAGDATNFVLVFAGELLAKAEQLLRMGLHASEIREGFEKASAQAISILQDCSIDTVTELKNIQQLEKIITGPLSSQQYGLEDVLVPIVAKACLSIMPKKFSNFNCDNVRIVKVLGGCTADTKVVNGMVFGREPEGLITSVKKAKIAIYSCPLDINRTETKGTVLIKNAQDMLDFSKGEEKALEDMLKSIVDTGVNVIVTGSAISDLALHFLNRMNVLVIKILSKFELRRLSRVCGATPLARMGPPMAEEMGFCDVVEAIEIGSNRTTVFRQEEEASRTVSIVIRGGTLNLLDDIERAIDDGVNVVKSITKDGRLVIGGGAAEIEIARQLGAIGEKTPGLAQYSIKKFAEAFEVVPRTLAENAGLNATEVIAKLYSAHQDADKQSYGVDVEGGESTGICDMNTIGVLDSLATKQNAIRLATDAVLNILSVDSIIMSKPAGGPKAPKKKGHWDDQD